MRGPKRASKIRKLFNLSKEDDVRKYVNTYRRTFTNKSGQLLSHYSFIYYFIWIWQGLGKLITRSWSGKVKHYLNKNNKAPFFLDLQARRLAKLPKFKGWLLPLLCKGSVQEYLTRRRESQRLRLRQQSTRSFSPPGWRSSVSAAVRAWQRRDLDYLLPQSPQLWLKCFVTWSKSNVSAEFLQ